MAKQRIEVALTCCLCDEGYAKRIKIPKGWVHRYEVVADDSSQVFCPEHAAVVPFVDSQCPGCVGNWGDCPLWKSFAYSHERTITEEDLETICEGRCPKRVNGGLISLPTGRVMEAPDVTGKEPKAGRAVAAAIKEYIRRYMPPEHSTGE